MATFAENLKNIRTEKGINQALLSQKTGLSQAAISQFENGERIPTPKNIQKIADALEVKVEKLTEGDAENVGKTVLMRTVKGMSKKSIDELNKYAQFLKQQDNL